MNNLPYAQDSKFNVARILMHDRTTTHKALFISCNELHATVPSECDFELNVACILMHDRITHDTLFISCNALHATARMISYRALFSMWCDIKLSLSILSCLELPDEQCLYHCVILISLKYCWRQGQPIASLVAMRLIRR